MQDQRSLGYVQYYHGEQNVSEWSCMMMNNNCVIDLLAIN